jgi:hypothetical protein
MDSQEMYSLIQGLSQRAFAASWMTNAEFQIWRLATEGGSWGLLDAMEESETLKLLLRGAVELGEWVRGPVGQVPIPLTEWREMYREWRNSPAFDPQPPQWPTE